MKKYAEVQTSNRPIIQVVFTGENADETNFPFYMDEVKTVYEQQQQVAIIFDATKAVMPSLSFQKMQADWLKENEKLMKDFCAGTAYIIPSAIIRGVLKTIFAFQKQPVPYLICKTKTEAEFWVKQQLTT